MAKKTVAKNYIFNLIYQMLAIVLPLITTPYLSRVLGSEPIGIYGYTISIVTYFVLFGTLGLTMYGQREIAYLQKDKKKRSCAFWEINIIKFVSFLISTTAFYLIFCIKGEYVVYYRILLLYMISNLIDISWMLQGLEEFGKTVVRNFIVKSLSLVLIFVCIKTPNDLWKYLLIFVSAELLGNLTMWMYLPKYIERVKISSLNITKHIKPAILLFIPQIATQVYTVLDKTMVGVLTNDMNEVGYYEQAQKLVRAALIIVTALGTVMSSRIAAVYAEKKMDELKEYLKSSFNFVWFLGLPMMFGLIGVSAKFVPWFYGDGFEKVIGILCVTSPILVAIGLNNVVGVQYLIQVKRQNQFTIAVTVGAVSNLLLNIVFIKLFNAMGAAIASVISEVIILIVELWFTRKEIKIKEILGSMHKYLIASIILFVVIICLEKYLAVSVLNTLICVAVGGIIYIVVLLVLRDRFILSLITKLKCFLRLGE